MLLALVFCVAINPGNLLAAEPALQSGNAIEGTIKNSNLRAIGGMRVILQDHTYSQMAIVYTDDLGLFRFGNLPVGVYFVEADPGVLNYERQSLRVEVIGRRGGSGEIFRVDLVLKAKSPDNNSSRIASPNKGVIFYQPVPADAKKEYASALKSLEKDDFKAAATSLNRAIEIFPDYFDALELLGTEYVKHQQYEPAIPHLERAIQVNKDGARAFYSLGLAQYETNQWDDAIKTFQRAVELNPDSPNTHMMLGMALATDAKRGTEAIHALEKAISIAKERVPQACFYLGALYAKNNQYREAANSLEEYLRLSPRAAERDKIKKLIKEFREKASAPRPQL